MIKVCSRVLCSINEKLDKMNYLKERELVLKERELKQNRFFIELIEEILPLDDARKRIIHEKTIRSNDYVY